MSPTQQQVPFTLLGAKIERAACLALSVQLSPQSSVLFGFPNVCKEPSGDEQKQRSAEVESKRATKGQCGTGGKEPAAGHVDPTYHAE